MEFACPEVTLCCWQDVKVQLLTNSILGGGELQIIEPEIITDNFRITLFLVVHKLTVLYDIPQRFLISEKKFEDNFYSTSLWCMQTRCSLWHSPTFATLSETKKWKITFVWHNTLEYTKSLLFMTFSNILYIKSESLFVAGALIFDAQVTLKGVRKQLSDPYWTVGECLADKGVTCWCVFWT